MKNPFVAGNWVRGENFFGRKALLNEILEGARDYLWVAGTRRLGKTSLLKQIEYLVNEGDYRDRYIGLFWDLQGAADLEGLAESLIWSAEASEEYLAEIGVEIAELESKSDVFEMLRVLKRQARQHQRTLLLLCDECEELINVEKRHPEALPRLRRFFQQGDHLRTVLAATKRLMQLEQSSRPETSPFLYGFIPPVYLQCLEDEAARELISRGGFPPETVELIMEKTHNHPYLIQLICKRLFESGDVDQVIEEISNDEMVAHFFKVDFDYLDATEKKILWHVLKEKEITVEELERKTDLQRENLTRILQDLFHLGYLYTRNGWVQIANYFFEKWLIREQDKLFAELMETGRKTPAAPSKEDTPSSEQPLTGKILSHYRIENRIGSGGMGSVYRAVDLRLDRTVALKTLAPGLIHDPELRERFIIEAKVASALNHPNIITIYEIDEVEGIPFFAMEYIDGVSLTEWKAQKPRDFREMIKIAIQAAEGLEYAHRHNIIHRDIKPDNIMVNREGVVKITDFGIAKALRRDSFKITRTGTTLGTPAYMSPEQAGGAELDPRSDIFSLGVVLFEFFTGKLPFEAEHEMAYIVALMQEEPLRAREVNPGLPQQLEEILGKMLAKPKDKRYQSLTETIRDLKEFLD